MNMTDENQEGAEKMPATRVNTLYQNVIPTHLPKLIAL